MSNLLKDRIDVDNYRKEIYDVIDNIKTKENLDLLNEVSFRALISVCISAKFDRINSLGIYINFEPVVDLSFFDLVEKGYLYTAMESLSCVIQIFKSGNEIFIKQLKSHLLDMDIKIKYSLYNNEGVIFQINFQNVLDYLI